MSLAIYRAAEGSAANTLAEEPWVPRVLRWLVLPFLVAVGAASIVEMRSDIVRNLH